MNAIIFLKKKQSRLHELNCNAEKGWAAYENLEDEESCHQRQFQPRVLWYTLKARQKTEYDREQHHKYRQKQRR